MGIQLVAKRIKIAIAALVSVFRVPATGNGLLERYVAGNAAMHSRKSFLAVSELFEELPRSHSHVLDLSCHL